jgi:hypothetical protein
MMMKELEPLMFLHANWSGSGQSPYGPYELEAVVEQRGRWLLLLHAIKSPDTHDVTYVSTQVYGFDGDKLTLDYFDTAGAFKFYGTRNQEHLVFDCKSGELWKKSEYWREKDGTVRFKYRSREQDSHSNELVTLEFDGVWRKQAEEKQTS